MKKTITVDAAVKLSDARAEMKKERETISQAIKILCSYLDTCASVKEVVHSKDFALSCATDIYNAMGVGQTYQVKKKTTNEAGEEVEEVVDRVRKPSADLCLRWFVSNQEANKVVFTEYQKKQAEKRNAKKEDKAAK